MSHEEIVYKLMPKRCWKISGQVLGKSLADGWILVPVRSSHPADIKRLLVFKPDTRFTSCSRRSLIRRKGLLLQVPEGVHRWFPKAETWIKESSVRSGHKTLRTFMKRSSLWYLPGEISSQMLGLTDELPVRTWNRHRAADKCCLEIRRETKPGPFHLSTMNTFSISF